MSLTSAVRVKIKRALLKILNHQNPGCKLAAFDPEFPWGDEKIQPTEELVFAHVGGLGDILFSLHFCKELAAYLKHDNFRYILYSGKNAMPEPAANFILPLLKNQEYISSCDISADIQGKHIMLDDYRNFKINFSSSDIRSWYYSFTQHHLPREFWKPVIFAEPDFSYRDKILICLTPRYRNVHIDCHYLKPFKNDMIFIGTPDEHKKFCQNFFELPYQPCKDMLQMAQYMAGAKGFIGNQSGIYSLAECMKIPRILLAPDFVDFHGVVIPGPHNNHPIGGWCEDVISTEKMIASVKALLEKE